MISRVGFLQGWWLGRLQLSPLSGCFIGKGPWPRIFLVTLLNFAGSSISFTALEKWICLGLGFSSAEQERWKGKAVGGKSSGMGLQSGRPSADCLWNCFCQRLWISETWYRVIGIVGPGPERRGAVSWLKQTRTFALQAHSLGEVQGDAVIASLF